MLILLLITWIQGAFLVKEPTKAGDAEVPALGGGLLKKKEGLPWWRSG